MKIRRSLNLLMNSCPPETLFFPPLRYKIFKLVSFVQLTLAFAAPSILISRVLANRSTSMIIFFNCISVSQCDIGYSNVVSASSHISNTQEGLLNVLITCNSVFIVVTLVFFARQNRIKNNWAYIQHCIIHCFSELDTIVLAVKLQWENFLKRANTKTKRPV